MYAIVSCSTNKQDLIVWFSYNTKKTNVYTVNESSLKHVYLSYFFMLKNRLVKQIIAIPHTHKRISYCRLF